MNRHEGTGNSSLSLQAVVLSLLISFLAASTAVAEAGPKWIVTLTDGSRIFVTPDSPTLPLVSDLLDAAISIPVAVICEVEPDSERGMAVDLSNGDRISGRLGNSLVEALRRSQTGVLSLYISWVVLGLIIIVVYLVMRSLV